MFSIFQSKSGFNPAPLNNDRFLWETDHRLWPLPATPWAMIQRWEHLLFAHWPIDPDSIKAAVPALEGSNLEVDTFEGKAWIAVVPFWLTFRTQPLYRLPSPLNGEIRFRELNVRTYVKRKNSEDPRPGVIFFSLDCTDPLSVFVARTFYHLPYFNATLHGRVDPTDPPTEWGPKITYEGRRHQPGPAPNTHGTFHSTYWPTGPVFYASPGTFEHWSTERYCLYTAPNLTRPVSDHNSWYVADIHHRPWPLQEAQWTLHTNTLFQSQGLTPHPEEPRLHYAKSIDVVSWTIEPLPKPLSTRST